MRSGTLSFGEERLRFSYKEVGTHSLRSGFSMDLLLARVNPETIMIIGWCSPNDFLRYIRIQSSTLRKGISDLMVSTQSFYTISEAEVICYTPVQIGVQSHRLNTQRGITNNANSSLLLPLLNGPKGSNTQATCSEKKWPAMWQYCLVAFILRYHCPESQNFRDERQFQHFSIHFNFR